MIQAFESVPEIFDVVRQLRDKLLLCNGAEAASELSSVLEGFWTTSSEALVEVISSLERARPDLRRHAAVGARVRLDYGGICPGSRASGGRLD